MSESNREVLVSGKTSFKIEVPYTLIETGKKDIKKPLIIYLHGYGQNNETFMKKCSRIQELSAYHLFIQGPYPVMEKPGKKNVSDWGRSWYLYDGNRGQFIKSLELASEFVQEVTDNMLKFINANRICVIGYSMGGYLGGYFALTRWKHVNELIVAGCRIKTEVLNENWDRIKHLNVLALHGTKDEKVKLEPQNEEIKKMVENGIPAVLKELDENHSFSTAYLNEILNWLKQKKYS